MNSKVIFQTFYCDLFVLFDINQSKRDIIVELSIINNIRIFELIKIMRNYLTAAVDGVHLQLIKYLKVWERSLMNNVL